MELILYIVGSKYQLGVIKIKFYFWRLDSPLLLLE